MRGCYEIPVPDETAVPKTGVVPQPESAGLANLLVKPTALPLPQMAVGVYCITAVCGLLDAASFLGFGQVFVEIMTGNLVFLAFSLGAAGPKELSSAFPGGAVLPYVVAIATFAFGAVAGGRLVRIGEKGRRIGFSTEAALIGGAVLATALTHPGVSGHARFLVVGILAFAMGIQNALMRRWGIPDLATNVMTLTLTGLLAESTLGGGNNPRALRRSASIAIFGVSAGIGAYLTHFGVLWPLLAGFSLFVLALPVLVQRTSE